MRLQKQLSKKIGDKEYAKYVIVVPPKVIEKLGWKDGEELEGEIKGDKLVIERDD
jgi:bifunctional DNA-binding transcriptional regulator/antitoxin component of YhaV-PrlF toxin-antitoxin module